MPNPVRADKLGVLTIFWHTDSSLLRMLMPGNNFPQIWVPSQENRDLRQLLWHRHRLVQMRTRIMNQLQGWP
jgi:transposase